jgi:hypothetical protein
LSQVRQSARGPHSCHCDSGNRGAKSGGVDRLVAPQQTCDQPCKKSVARTRCIEHWAGRRQGWQMDDAIRFRTKHDPVSPKFHADDSRSTPSAKLANRFNRINTARLISGFAQAGKINIEFPQAGSEWVWPTT